MNKLMLLVCGSIYFLLAEVLLGQAGTQTMPVSPIQILRPPYPILGSINGPHADVRIKVHVLDTNLPINRVELYADALLIDTRTNAPYIFLWQTVFNPGQPVSEWNFIARALENSGKVHRSEAVKYFVSGTRPATAEIEITAPTNGSFLPAGGNFVFSAELLSTAHTDHEVEIAVEFHIGTNFVGKIVQGSRTIKPYSIIASNLSQGDYVLIAKASNPQSGTCVSSNKVRVVELAAIRPLIKAGNLFEFDIITAFPGKDTQIQVSANLLDWDVISTIKPTSSTCKFVDSQSSNFLQRFYRVFVSR